MIRTAYPVPPLAQFRARIELVARRTRRAIEARRRSLRREDAAGAVRSDAPSVMIAQNEHRELLRGQEVARHRATYDAFFDQYDALIGLLCLAAHEGWKPHHEDEFRGRRAWLRDDYPSLRPHLAPFLDVDPDDPADDPFEALLTPPSLAALLEKDGGYLIGRMCRTQAALDLWDRALRREEAALVAFSVAKV